jgi:branched-chain amino acid transport system ATP-binding protein
MSAPLLEIRNLGVSYGRIEAVQGANLAVGAGRIASLIGANGAGKSSLLNAVMGLLDARGEVWFEGERVDHLDVDRRVARGLVLVPERRELFATMSVEDNLRLGAYLGGAAQARRGLEQVHAMFPRLLERRLQQAGTLSGGERQMLALGRALMSSPRLLMLDEPSLGLAPLMVRERFQSIARLKEAGVAILVVEQNARAALQISDDAYVMEHGQIGISGPAQQLLRDPRVIESYLGVGRAAAQEA